MAALAVLHEPRFVDLVPAEVYATLLDEDRYLCSERTM
jgi:putative transposase